MSIPPLRKHTQTIYEARMAKEINNLSSKCTVHSSDNNFVLSLKIHIKLRDTIHNIDIVSEIWKFHQRLLYLIQIVSHSLRFHFQCSESEFKLLFHFNFFTILVFLFSSVQLLSLCDSFVTPMPFSRIIPPPLPQSQQTVYTSVSFAVSHSGLLLPSF